MDINESNLFDNEDRILREAEDIISDNSYSDNPLLRDYISITKSFEKVLSEFKKIIKISDGQQLYLHAVQDDLCKEIEERSKIEEKLEKLVTFDSLTGVYNRGIGFIMLEEQLKRIKRTKEKFSICFIDVDRLKDVNDNYGHYEGDQLIRGICDAFKDIIRACDTICRLGGDEFLIILSCCNKQEAEGIINRTINSDKFTENERNKPYGISFSYGIVEVNSEAQYNTDELIALADKRMYQHKQRLVDFNR